MDRTLRVPLLVAKLEGRRYLVSMLGKNADWVRNLRAPNGEAVLLHGITEPVKRRRSPFQNHLACLRRLAVSLTLAFEVWNHVPLHKLHASQNLSVLKTR